MRKWTDITVFFVLSTLCFNMAYAGSASTQSTNAETDDVELLPIIFLATNGNAGYSGNFSGTSGADTFCNSTSERPDNQTYKALILYKGDGSSQERYPCTSAGQCGEGNSKNWVLQPNTTYYNTSTASIGTTTSDAIFAFPLKDAFSHTQDPTNNSWITHAWTGALQDWTPSEANCLGWTDMNSWNFGANGNNTSVNADAIGQTSDAYGLDCHLPLALYCVSQP